MTKFLISLKTVSDFSRKIYLICSQDPLKCYGQGGDQCDFTKIILMTAQGPNPSFFSYWGSARTGLALGPGLEIILTLSKVGDVVRY